MVAGNKPTVTVVITTYERNQFLRNSIESVLAQEYTGEIEILVVDGTEDRTAKVVVDECDQTNYLNVRDYHEPFQSSIKDVAAARSVGVRECQGKYVQFLDDDDKLTTAAIQKKIAAIQKDDAVAVCTGLSNGEENVMEWPDTVVGKELAYALIKLNPPAPPSSLLVERDLLMNIPPFHELPHDDLAMFIEVAKQTPVNYVDEPLTVLQDSRTLAQTKSSIEGLVETYQWYKEEGLYDVILTEEQREAANNKYEEILDELSGA